jgi:hypothetical protein
MQVFIESIDQRVRLDSPGEEASTIINIRLQDGSYIAAKIDNEAAGKLMQLSVSTTTRPVPPAYVSENVSDVGDVFSGEESGQEGEQQLDWEQLPDESLSAQLKQVLRDINAPKMMAASDLVALVDQISERMLIEAQERAKPPTQKAPMTPGQLQRVRGTRPRTVPKDEYGYPIVPQIVDRDPGEVALMGSDEDGVPQL